MSKKAKPVRDSYCMMSEIVLPNDTNSLGNLMGGRLLHWMDICAAISAQRHAECVSVTAAVDTVEFHSAIRQGEVIVLESQVNRAFRTSMEVEINVRTENPRTGASRHSNNAFFTFVAVDSEGKPFPIPCIEPETDDEKARYESAKRRRDFRHLLAGRIRAEDAPDLIAFLDNVRQA